MFVDAALFPFFNGAKEAQLKSRHPKVGTSEETQLELESSVRQPGFSVTPHGFYHYHDY